MAGKSLREEALQLEKSFQDVISNDYKDERYKTLSQIINFMKSHTDSIQQLSCDKAIFLVGPTGAGKSTLMNYLFKEDNLYVSGYGRMYAKDSIADIGEGTSGSTTIFPNVWKQNEGTFVDCAGDFDSGGIIIDAINSKAKAYMANNVRFAKVLFVTPQASLSAEGAYGKIFKEAIDKNAKFFNDINYFKDNIVLVISHASRNERNLETIDALLDNVMNQSSFSNYAHLIRHVMEQNNMVAFCKPSEEARCDDLYKAPVWNITERELIICRIASLNFAEIPKDFFNISASLEVKEQMGKALTIVKMKAAEILTDAINKAITPKLTVYAAELKLLADFLKKLLTKHISASLDQYIKYLNYNDFLKISPDPIVINKLISELTYLKSYTNDCENGKEQNHNYDWNNLTGIPTLLHSIYDEVMCIINKSSELFKEFGSYHNLIVIGRASDSINIKKLFKALRESYEEKLNIESLMHNTVSKYYYDDQVEEFIGMKNVPCTRIETYWESEPYTKTVTYEEDVPYTEIEYYDDEEEAPGRTILLSVITLGTAPLVKGLFTGDPTLHDTVRRRREVTKYRRQLVEKQVTDHKNAVKTKEVSDTKEEPVYKYVTKRKFNESEYKKDIKKIDDSIAAIRKNITDAFSKIELVNQNMEKELNDDILNKVRSNTDICKNLENTTHDQYTTQFKELYEQWKTLELRSLFLNKPNMSLDIGNMEQLLNQDAFT